MEFLLKGFLVMVFLWGFFRVLCEVYYWRYLGRKVELSKYGRGSWALVAEAKEGISLSFARALAAHNFNIVLVGKDFQKLKAFQEELVKFHSVGVKVFHKDFQECFYSPSEFFSELEKDLVPLDISIVVSNFEESFDKLFSETTTQEATTQNALSLWPVVYLTKALCSRMTQRDFSSAVISVNSGLSLKPGRCFYLAGKSFEDLFTLIAKEEVNKRSKHKVDFLSLRLGYVDSNANHSQECVEPALAALGRVPYCCGSWKHILDCLK